MINVPRLNSKNVSLESTTRESAMSEEEALASSTSSFQKPELSKQSTYGESTSNEIEIQRRRGLHQEDTHFVPKRRSCLKSNNTMSAPNTAPRGEKSVNFEKTARVRRVRTRNHFSKQEQESMWYSDDEYASIKRGAVDTVRRMLKGQKSGGFVDDENYSARGLECRMKKTAVQRKEFKAFARELVLTEQEDQNARGIFCSSRLRKVYLQASSIASMKAQAAAQKDEQAVNDLHLSDILPIFTLEHRIF